MTRLPRFDLLVSKLGVSGCTPPYRTGAVNEAT